MRTSLGLVIMFIVLLLAGSAGAEEKIYGLGVSAPDTVKVSYLLANPDAFLDQTIRVQGVAVGVCKHRGCWIDLASDVEGQTVRVKVKDGEIVFPPEILGDVVLAEGVWTANNLDMETTRRVCAAEARKKGEDFDPEGVTSCLTLYQLSGTGAVANHQE